MIQKLKSWWRNRHLQAERQWLKNINNEAETEYNVVERHGYLYLTAGGYAFMKIDGNKTVDEVINMISDARIAQITFRKNSPNSIHKLNE